MEKEAGDSVLALFRTEDAGFPKPHDIEYMSNINKNNMVSISRNVANRDNRGKYPNVSSATYAKLAKSRAVDAGAWSVCTGVIGNPLVKHHFCVADYYPHAGSAQKVVNLPFDPHCESAWIIDPWMNISCNFEEYPDRVMKKLCRWSSKEKKILRKRTGLRYFFSGGWNAQDPGSPGFLNSVLTAELKFEAYWDDESGKPHSLESGVPSALRNLLPDWAPRLIWEDPHLSPPTHQKQDAAASAT